MAAFLCLGEEQDPADAPKDHKLQSGPLLQHPSVKPRGTALAQVFFWVVNNCKPPICLVCCISGAISLICLPLRAGFNKKGVQLLHQQSHDKSIYGRRLLSARSIWGLL